MLEKFSKVFDHNFIHTGKTNWLEPQNQEIEPKDVYNKYNQSIFVPIGRGNKSLDCFRLYEAILAGAIPVMCSSQKELSDPFRFNGNLPIIISSETWDEALVLCKEIHNDQARKDHITQYNLKWWKEQIIDISNKITESFK